MECNKEEAIRAKEIAENKMRNRDFLGARKIVLKAQQLFPDLENVSQMLTVCEVHCSAGNVVNGEIDWYGILQVGPTTDDSTIKKQYRKLALLLHPDKNKFGGAEAAFKLVGEAHRTLSDRAKRSLHDMKRGVGKTASSKPVQQSNSSYTKKQPGVAVNVTSKQFNGISQPQPPSSSGNQTFWTICPFCEIRYQYYQAIMNRALRCQSCMKPFIAYEFNAQPVPSAAPWNHTGNPQKEQPCPGAHSDGKKNALGTASGMAFRGNVGGSSTVSEPRSGGGIGTKVGAGDTNNAREDGKDGRDSGKVDKMKYENVKLPGVKREQAVRPSAGNVSQKRGRKVVVESSDSDSSDSDVQAHDHPLGQDMSASHTPRRSTRQKQNVSYKENKVVVDDDNDDDDDDFVTPKSKRLKEETTPDEEQSKKEFHEGKTNDIKAQSDVAVNTNKKERGNEGDLSESLPNVSHGLQHVTGKRTEDLHTDASSKANATVDFSTNASPVPDTFFYQDPEFCDFTKERDESKFAAGQIWAAYDELDAMPRYYAWIKQIYSPKFKLRFTWLEYDPVSKNESMWYEGDLPVGCGRYKHGKSEYAQDCLMFSHLMPLKKGTKKNSFEIYPRKGEVWALFKDWNIEWACHVDDNRQYEYEVVEILSDFTEGEEITAIRLVKIQGFVGLFVKSSDRERASLKIFASDVLQFSHRIPSYKLRGDEREGIPKGSVELDCGSLLPNFSATYPSISLESIKVTVEDLDGMCNSSNIGSREEFPTRTISSNSKLNEKVVEIHSSSSDNKENGDCKKESSHSSTAECAASGLGKRVEIDQLTQQQFCTKEENLHGQDPKSSRHECQTRSQPPSPGPNTYEYPDSEFHDFEEGRSVDKFERGQIWALYSDIDSYPKYYALIRKVELENFKVHVRWLEGFSDQEEDGQWCEKQLPVGCGTFKIISERAVFDSVDTFSHLVHANLMAGNKLCVINPNVGEIWALYKNWNHGWSISDLENCEFDVVEILASGSSHIKFSILTKVNGYRAVFMPQNGRILEIPSAERLRFSHRIPAFRLTEERGGKLRGYWELDPASVPELLLF